MLIKAKDTNTVNLSILGCRHEGSVEGEATQKIAIMAQVDMVIATHSHAHVDVNDVLLVQRVRTTLLGRHSTLSLLL